MAEADVEAHRDLARFTDFAVQFRYDAEPEPMGLDRAEWMAKGMRPTPFPSFASDSARLRRSPSPGSVPLTPLFPARLPRKQNRAA